MNRRRVVITVVEAVIPIGNTEKETYQNGLAGKNGIAEITNIDTAQFNVHIGGEVKNLNIEDFIERKEARRMDKFTQFAVVAADEAVKESGLVINEDNATRVGVWIGSGIGGIQSLEDGFIALTTKGPRRVSPFFVPMMKIGRAHV